MNQVNTEEKSENELTEWLFNRDQSPIGVTNVKSEFRGVSAQDSKHARKKNARHAKKKTNKNTRKNNKYQQKNSSSQAESKPEENETKPVLYINGGYDVFADIMNGTYNGEMDSVEQLIKTRFNGLVYLNKGRWHFAIPHIYNNNSTVFNSILEPLAEDDNGAPKSTDSTLPITSSNSSSSSSASTTTHNPHKNGSKRLRPYHVSDIRNMFERAGFTLETVKKNEKKD